MQPSPEKRKRTQKFKEKDAARKRAFRARIKAKDPFIPKKTVEREYKRDEDLRSCSDFCGWAMTLAKEPAHDEAATSGTNRRDKIVWSGEVSAEATHVRGTRIQIMNQRV